MSSNTTAPSLSPSLPPTLLPTTDTSDDDKFTSSITSGIPIFLVFFFCFLLLRRRLPGIYMSNDISDKVEDEEDKSMSKDNHDAEWLQLESVTGIFDVLKEVWGCDAEKIQELAGFDAMVFTTMLFFMFKLFLILIPVTFILLVPVYATGGETTDPDGEVLALMSLSNVQTSEAWRVWFTVIIATVLHVGSTWFLQDNFQKLSEKADEFNAESRESRNTLLFEDVPEKFIKGRNLYVFLDRLYPGKVCNVDMCYDLGDVQKLWSTYAKAKEQRELCQQSEGQEIGQFCFKKDLETCKALEKEAKHNFKSLKMKELPVIPVAVVQFVDMMTSTSCAASVLIPGGKGMKVRAMPEFPEEVLWRNLSYTAVRKKAGMYIGTLIYLLLIVFYTPVMVFIQGLANLDTLAELWSGFEAVLDWNSSIRSTIQGSLPAIVFSLFFVILPKFLKQLSYLALPAYSSDVLELTLKRYADCLIGMGLLVSVFSSGVLSSMDAISSLSASEIWETLGTEVPAQSVFFLTYIITACFINMAMNLAMVVPFFKNMAGLYKPKPFKFDVQYGVMILMFTICVTYAVIAPMVLICGCVYFFFAYMTFTYQLLYVFKRGNDTGGRSFPSVYGKLSNGMLIGQFVIIAIMILANAIPQAVLFLFVPIYTISARRQAVQTYGYYFGRTSLHSARLSDIGIRNKGKSPVVAGENNFMAPAVKALREKSHRKNERSRNSSRGKVEMGRVSRKRKKLQDDSSDSTDIENLCHYGSVTDNAVYL